MHHTRSYANSPCPKVDAINDIKDWLGDHWDKISAQMSEITNQHEFVFCAAFVGVQGFPVIAWWELYHGEGSWSNME